VYGELCIRGEARISGRGEGGGWHRVVRVVQVRGRPSEVVVSLDVGISSAGLAEMLQREGGSIGCGCRVAVKGGTYLNVSLSRTFSDTLGSAAGADGACAQLGWSIRSIAPWSNGSLASRGCYTLLPWTSLLLNRMIAYMEAGIGSRQHSTGQDLVGLVAGGIIGQVPDKE
jgi:hypothetical protein